MPGEREYWLWLSAALGAGVNARDIVNCYDCARDVYEAGPDSRFQSGLFSSAQLDSLNATSLQKADFYSEICRKNSWSFVTPADDGYPELLLRTRNYPLVLFVWGDISYINEKVPIGMVGTRKPCFDSVLLARSIGADCARAGAVVVSGGALGIDSASHEGALAAGGKTVAVLGCGLGVNYLMHNAALRKQISESGAVISEYLPFAPVTRSSFPLRNRIISGMSLATLVVEAGEKSGSLITARCARDQGRDVYAVPGDVLAGAYGGANGLLRSGARPAKNARELLEEYALLYPDRLDLSKLSGEAPQLRQKVRKAADKAPVVFTADAKLLLEHIGEEKIHTDELAAEVDIGAGRIAAALVELESNGAIEALPGKHYIRAN